MALTAIRSERKKISISRNVMPMTNRKMGAILDLSWSL